MIALLLWLPVHLTSAQTPSAHLHLGHFHSLLPALPRLGATGSPGTISNIEMCTFDLPLLEHKLEERRGPIPV